MSDAALPSGEQGRRGRRGLILWLALGLALLSLAGVALLRSAMDDPNTKVLAQSQTAQQPVQAPAAGTAGGAGNSAAKGGLAAPAITSGPAAFTTATNASFTFTGPSGASFQCSLGSAVFSSCATPVTYSGLVQGAHAFQVRSVSGAAQSAATSYSWTVDTTAPPAPTFVTKPTAFASSTSATFSFADGESGVSYLCKLDGAAGYTACSNPQMFSGLAQGNHTVAVEAKDAASNVGPAASYSWKVDTLPPPVPVLTQKPNDPAVGATQTFAWTDSEAGVTFECAGENGSFAACTSPYSYVVNTSNNGQHQFAVRAIDAAGNRSGAASYSFKVTKDTTTGVPFQITGSVAGLVLDVWKPLAVHVTNPNNVPIYVTALTFTVAADSTPSGCLSSTNVERQQSNISATQVLMVPAHASVDLPAQGVTAPQIRLKNLPTNQDVCKNKSFVLTYSGTAHN